VCILRFFGGHNGRPYNPSEQGWNERFGELTATVSELQFVQKGQVNHCSCCGGITPTKYEQVEIPQPEDRGILLKDILESEVDEKYFLPLDTKVKWIDKGLSKDGKAKAMSASMWKGIGNDGTTLVLGTLDEGTWAKRYEQVRRVYGENGKAATIPTGTGGGVIPKIAIISEATKIRKLTPAECLRLQSMPDNYFNNAIVNKKLISNSQRYKMCGNAFNCEVVKHIVEKLLFDK